MAYVKDPPPIGATEAQQQAYQDRELTKLELEDRELRRIQSILARLIAINGVAIEWRWQDTTGLTDPGAGYMGGDQNQLVNMTVLRFSDIDHYGRDVRAIFPDPAILKAGDFITVYNPDRSQAASYTADAATTFEAGWFWVPVTYVSGAGGNPSQDNHMVLRFSPDYNALIGAEGSSV